MQKKIKINSNIYNRKFIEKAIIDFYDVGKIEYKNGFLIINDEKIEYIDEIFNEFMNYIIGLINE